MTSLSELTVEELADGICLRAGRIAAAQAELLAWVAEFDQREGWAGHGILSCAHWLSWRIGLSPSAAREQVRVARRLTELPAVEEAFGGGRISYSKVRAITRAAEPEDGIDWVELARHSSGAQLEKIARGVRRARTNAAARLDPAAAEWSLRTRIRYDDNGNFIMTISGPGELGPVVKAGIEAKRAELQRQRDEEAKTAAADVPVPRASEPAPAATPEPAPESEASSGASAESSAAVQVVPDAPSAPAHDVTLDEQADGWPTGTTRRDVDAALASFFAGQSRLADETSEILGLPERPEPPVVPAPRSGEAPLKPSAEATGDSAEARTESPTAPKVTDAEALLAMAQDALAAEQAAHPDIFRRRRPQLTAQIDPLSGWARLADGELLPPSSLRAVMKTLPGRDGVLRLRPVSPADLRRHDLGRTQREANLALRELLGTIDGERCRFPGCTRHKKLHAHHVVYWSAGGATDMDNLVLVCSRHHTLIHTQGFVLELHADRTLDVRTQDGVPILHHPTEPWADPTALARDRGQLVTAESLPPDHCTDRMDLGYVVSVLLAQAA
jgi:hypothetical protein